MSKESIFTGLNNPKVYSITDVRYGEYFGFIEAEVSQILADYGLEDRHDVIKEWYDGYLFGDQNVYCPWDVINYCDNLCASKAAEPQTYWINTSGNSLVKLFIDKADRTTQSEIECLIDGNAIEKRIMTELTYPEIDRNIDNLWSVLFR